MLDFLFELVLEIAGELLTAGVKGFISLFTPKR